MENNLLFAIMLIYCIRLSFQIMFDVVKLEMWAAI